MIANRMLSDRIAIFTESVIREMTRLSMQHNAINLAQGYPDFPAPEAIKEAAVAAVRADHNQYAITWGAKSLRDAITRKVKRFNGIDADPERNVTVTCGATEAMMASLLAVVNPGDEVIVFEPFYENYGPDAAICGAKLVFVPLEGPEYTFDPDRLRAAFSPRTKAVIVNTPNNPSGRVLNRQELTAIAELCQEYNALAITDEIYEHIIYDGHKHISMATLPGMGDRTITISGLSKTFSVTGWRVGYIIAPAELTDGVRKVHDFLTVGAPAPLQEAAAVALGFPDSYYEELARAYTRRREILYDALVAAGLPCTKPEGAYYIMADITGFGDRNDIDFSRYLTEAIGVAPVPGSSFYADRELGRRRIRFTFSKRDETLHAAAKRLTALKAPSGVT
ncbi:MAG: pyridoxal phosphate-dependent aminotransferase [Dehalococcoidia bacterium]